MRIRQGSSALPLRACSLASMGTRFISRVVRAGGCLCRYTAARRLSVPLLHLQHSAGYQQKMSYTAVERGTPNSLNYRVFFKNANGEAVSPFHDIPLIVDEAQGIFNMVVEIPRWTNAKMEICKEEKLNPIKQDVKKGKLRYVKNIFPHKGYIWNYGALPQTYEDPTHVTPDTGAKGDSDPLDVCEIGYKVHERGAVIQVKAVGIMCLIDEGETDWKVLAIDVTDPLADKINDVADIEANFPGLIRATYEWFKYYKVPDDKPENQFAFNGDAKNREYTLNVIRETHSQWKDLVNKEKDTEIARDNVTVSGSPFSMSASAANEIVQATPGLGAPDSVSQDVNKWYYVIPQSQ